MKIAVLLTSHNRIETTMACLGILKESSSSSELLIHVILVDDGSTDGTVEAVSRQHPWVEIILGDGSLFWSKGMYRAFSRAMEITFDAYLWLNDDTILDAKAIGRIVDTWLLIRSQTHADAIIVGTTRDPDTSLPTYGGVIRESAWKPFRYSLVMPGNKPVECHTMNGNCVLIPHSVAKRVGNLDPAFAHAMGDTDYGLRARAAGCKIWVAPFYVGWCSRNTLTGTFSDPTLPLSQRWKYMTSRKGLPVRSWLHFTRRHGGLLWPIYFAWPYARLLISGLARKGGKRNAQPFR